MFSSDYSWLLFAYVVGTAFGYFIGVTSKLQSMTASIIDTLVEQGYLKSFKDSDGEIQIVKWREWNDQNSGKDS